MEQSIYGQWAETFKAIGACHITRDTCARILAVIYVYGGSSEDFTHNTRLRTDYQAAAERFHVHGTGVVSPDDAALVRRYVRELESDADTERIKLTHTCGVTWANELFKQRYNISLQL